MAYCTKSDIENVFGVENVKTWSDLDNSGSADTTRITQAIAVADDRIDDVARVIDYTVPLANASGSTPDTVKDLSATFAGIWLYEARGSQDYNPQTGEVLHRLEFKRDRSEMVLDNLRTGRIRIDALH